MEIESPSCPVCYAEFDQAEHLPRVIPSCGHTVCTACLTVLIQTLPGSKCPIDKIQFPPQLTKVDLFPTNFILNQLISTYVPHQICCLHDEPMRLVCMKDKCLVCDECAYEGVHKGHEIKPIKKFKAEIDVKRNTLETSLEQLDAHSRQLVNLLEQGRSAMSALVEEKFNQIKLVIHQKELEFLYEINSFFDSEKEKTNGLYGANSDMRNFLTSRINKQKNFLSGKDFFEIINEDVPTIVNKCNQAMSKDCVSKLSEDLDNITKTLNEALAAQPDPFNHWHFPIKDQLLNMAGACFSNNNIEDVSQNIETEDAGIEFETFLKIKINNNVLDVSVQNQKNRLFVKASDMKKISKVNIELQYYDIIKSELQTFYWFFNKLGSLEGLKVKFSGSRVTDEDIFKTFPIFSKLDSLKELEVNFEKSAVTDKSLTFFSEKILLNMKNLQGVNIKLYKTNITNHTLKALADTALPSLQALSHFRISLRSTKVSNEGLIDLFGALPYRLETLDINLMETDVSDASLCIFAQKTLLRMKKLENLELLLWKTAVGNEGVIELFKSLPNVTILRLNLDSTGINDKSIEMFMNQTVQKMRNLKELKIDITNTQVSSHNSMQLKELSRRLAN